MTADIPDPGRGRQGLPGLHAELVRPAPHAVRHRPVAVSMFAGLATGRRQPRRPASPARHPRGPEDQHRVDHQPPVGDRVLPHLRRHRHRLVRRPPQAACRSSASARPSPACSPCSPPAPRTSFSLGSAAASSARGRRRGQRPQLLADGRLLPAREPGQGLRHPRHGGHHRRAAARPRRRPAARLDRLADDVLLRRGDHHRRRASSSSSLLREPVRGYMERRAMGASDEVALQESEPQSFGEAWRTVWAVRTLRRHFIAGMIAAPALLIFGAAVPVPAGRASTGSSAVERFWSSARRRSSAALIGGVHRRRASSTG